jgi:hypothetical protein
MPKVVVIVLVALVMLFVITLGLGGSHDNSKSPARKDPVEFLEGLTSKRFLTSAVGVTTCQAATGKTIVVGGPCEVQFADRGFLKKPTRVLFQPNAPVIVKVDPERGPEQEAAVTADECFQSSVDASGGVMMLAPAAGSPVTLTLADDTDDLDCPEPEEED